MNKDQVKGTAKDVAAKRTRGAFERLVLTHRQQRGCVMTVVTGTRGLGLSRSA